MFPIKSSGTQKNIVRVEDFKMMNVDLGSIPTLKPNEATSNIDVDLTSTIGAGYRIISCHMGFMNVPYARVISMIPNGDLGIRYRVLNDYTENLSDIHVYASILAVKITGGGA
ncbi:hypothetical protein B5F14_06625 [Faecalitalea cylindroides]|uniref:Uncharacterized protein n=1 Tax=Faecalitalea cylindroides TaxID=39483 RepID=A0A1Y4LTX4_9FIRM|nr:hypothetical protein [Faecalitalea cylindroides]OUP60086.1 hypothetical protein B5F14_06625 [Faecalitalea cylindroides]